MAKGGNTWCKKLMTKDKANKVKAVLGTAPRKGAAGVREINVVSPRNGHGYVGYGDVRKHDVVLEVVVDQWAYLQGTHWNDKPMGRRARKTAARLLKGAMVPAQG